MTKKFFGDSKEHLELESVLLQSATECQAEEQQLEEQRKEHYVAYNIEQERTKTL